MAGFQSHYIAIVLAPDDYASWAVLDTITQEVTRHLYEDEAKQLASVLNNESPTERRNWGWEPYKSAALPVVLSDVTYASEEFGASLHNLARDIDYATTRNVLVLFSPPLDPRTSLPID